MPSLSGFVFGSPRSSASQRNVHSFKNGVTKLFKRYSERVGLPESITFHSLRHGFCTTLAEAGESAYLIMKAARHETLSVSQRYVDIQDMGLGERLTAAQDRVVTARG